MELRYVDQTANKNLLWGVLVNNGPTIQDVYNTGGARERAQHGVCHPKL